MTEAAITPAIIDWARDRASLQWDELATSVRTSQRRLEEWVAGKRRPTLRQAWLLAKALRLPLGYLFLPEPPTLDTPLPDLRSVEGAPLRMSPDLYEVLNDVLLKQEWYRQYMLEEGASRLDFVSRYSLADPVTVVAESVRETLRLSLDLSGSASTWDEYLRKLVERAGSAGIIVQRSGIVKSNTHRRLNTSEFLGFAISDDIAPFVFLNTRDFIARKIFTLVHELAHIWIGESGISDKATEEEMVDGRRLNRVEDFCDSVAAEVLVPSSDFLLSWKPRKSCEENLKEISRLFRVSQLVILRRARLLETISYGIFIEEWKRLRLEVRSSPSRSPGGDAFDNLLARNSPELVEAVIASAFSGELPFVDAASTLSISIPAMKRAGERMGIV